MQVLDLFFVFLCIDPTRTPSSTCVRNWHLRTILLLIKLKKRPAPSSSPAQRVKNGLAPVREMMAPPAEKKKSHFVCADPLFLPTRHCRQCMISQGFRAAPTKRNGSIKTSPYPSTRESLQVSICFHDDKESKLLRSRFAVSDIITTEDFFSSRRLTTHASFSSDASVTSESFRTGPRSAY